MSTLIEWGSPPIQEILTWARLGNTTHLGLIINHIKRCPELLEARDKHGGNLLHAFVYFDTPHIFVWALIALGADPDEKNARGMSARDYARGLGRVYLYKAINSAKPTPEEKDLVLRDIYAEMDRLHDLHDLTEPDTLDLFYKNIEDCNARIVDHKSISCK